MSEASPTPELFDHTAHCRVLEEASRELRRLGTNHLASEVDRAIKFHNDLVERIHSARDIQDRLHRLADKLHAEARALGEYVTSENLPWTSRLKAFIWPSR